MKEIKFVDVGEGITEGQIQKWLVNDGDTVKEDQSVAMVETDKAVVEVPSPISGMIRINLPANTILHLGDSLAAIGTADELKNYKPGTAMPAQPAPAKAAAPMQAPAPKASAPKEILATPAVRKMAHDMNVDLSMVTGTGPNGRVLESDLKAYSTKGAAPAPMAAARPAMPMEGAERVPMSMTRRAIARNMEESWKIPRSTHMDLIDATELWAMVAKEKPKLQKEQNIHLTFLPFLIKALVQALKENPNFNASYDRDAQEIIVKHFYNIGLAAEAPDGLKVVVIKDADKKSITKLAKEVQDLHDKVTNKTISLDEMKDSTITITNIGSLGGGFLAVPMINPPNVAIIGILSIRDWPFVEDGKVRIGKVMPFTITFDHRVVDGAEAVKLGNAFKNYLEDVDFLEML